MVSTDRSLKRTVLLLVVVALVALAGCGGQLGGAGDAGSNEAADGGANLAADSGGQSSYYQGGDRVVVREAEASVRVENFSRSLDRLRAVADRNGGFVGDRRMRTEGEWTGGTVTVRVPAENFSATRDAVADLGRLEEERVRALDFTGEYRDRDRRIQQLERDRRELARLLNRTENASEASDLRAELQDVRAQLRELRSEQSQLRERQALSTIEVRLQEPERRKPPRTYETAFGFGDAFVTAFYGGLTAVKYVVVFFGYAIPVGIAALLAGTFGLGLWQVWRRIRGSVDRLFDGGGRSQTADGRSGDESTATEERGDDEG